MTYTIRASQNLEEAERFSRFLIQKGFSSKIDCVEAQSTYSNAIQWFQVNVPLSEKDQVLAMLKVHEKTEDNKIASDAKKLKTPADAWKSIALGMVLLVVSIVVLLVSGYYTGYSLIAFGTMTFALSLILKGVFRLKNTQ